MVSDRNALVLDGADTHLGAASLKLLRLGIDVVYAKDLDEACLLAQQEAQRIGAILFPPSVEVRGPAGLAAKVAEVRGGRPPQLLVIGEEPDADVKQSLRTAGVERALFEPYDESALRFAVNAAVCAGFDGDPRTEMRIPTTLRGRTYKGTRRRDVLVSTLSAQGAYLETPHPDPVGSLVRVEIDLPEQPLFARAVVRYTPDPESTRGLPPGMGIVFQELPEPDEARLRSYIHTQSQRFTLG